MKRNAAGIRSDIYVNTLLVFCILFLIGCLPSAATPLSAQDKPGHHSAQGFRNYPPVSDPPPVGAAFYLRRVLDSFFLPGVPVEHYLSQDTAITQLQKFNGQNSITWLGHSSFLLTVDGKTLLTDPFLTEYASPLWEFGPRRFVQPGISLQQLPRIDIIVVSHNHLDHLDAETIESLAGRENIQVFVPLGLKPFFSERGYNRIKELDWNESYRHEGIEFRALPAVHYSGRGLNDKNKTLWCSWSISSPAAKVFFSGDTSYSPTVFKTIGEAHGPFDLAIVSIGAYNTRDHGPASHLTPEQAVNVALETRGRIAVAMHWGTIQLSDEPPWEPAQRFIEAARVEGMSAANSWVMKIGETRLLPANPTQ